MRRNDIWIIFSIASLVLILDRLTKYIAYVSLSQGQSVKIFPNIFHITLVLNKGAAFGLLQEQRLFFIILSFVIICFILFYIWANDRRMGITLPLAFALILAGATGNLIDRLKLGYVIDFLDFRVWPVFNIADSALTIGTIILAFKVLFKKAHGSKPTAQS